MTPFINAKHKKSDKHWQDRVAANVIEYLIITKLIFPIFILLKFKMIRQKYRQQFKGTINESQHVIFQVLLSLSKVAL